MKELQLIQDKERLRKFICSLPDILADILCSYQKSLLYLCGSEILICCAKASDAETLFLNSQSLKKAAASVEASRITLRSIGSEYRRSLLVRLSSTTSTIMNQTEPQQHTDSRILTISEWDLKKELCQFDGTGGAKVVRFFDDQSIDCAGSVELSSGVPSNDWIRLDHKSLWIPEEFSTFKSKLMSEVELKNYPYTAYLANGQKCRFVVDARLSNYRGNLVRIVKVHSCVPVY